MLSKLSKNLSNKISGSLDLQIHNNKSMVKVALTHITRDRENKYNLKKFVPIHMKTRLTGRRRSLKVV
jgi:hypothetical protein